MSRDLRAWLDRLDPLPQRQAIALMETLVADMRGRVSPARLLYTLARLAYEGSEHPVSPELTIAIWHGEPVSAWATDEIGPIDRPIGGEVGRCSVL